jgi:hypothetical protein
MYKTLVDKSFSILLNKIRREKLIGLKDFSRLLECPPSRVSGLLYGCYKPPPINSEEFKKIVKVLGIKENSKEYNKLILAAQKSRKSPVRNMTEKETCGCLPLFLPQKALKKLQNKQTLNNFANKIMEAISYKGTFKFGGEI